MRALILAAGQGTRLRPLTDDKPKCLVRLGDLSLLELSLHALREAGIEDITIVGGYRADQLREFGTNLVINPQFETTNMVYSMFCAEELFAQEEDLFVVYGDIVFETKVLQSLRQRDAEIAVVVDKNWYRLWSARMDDPLSDVETLKMDECQRLVELGKKPRSKEDIQAQYIGLFKVRGDCIRRFREEYRRLDPSRKYDGKNLPNMFMTSFLQHLIDTGWQLQAVPIESGWLEVDSVDDLESYSNMLNEKSLNPLYFSPLLEQTV